jgi:hypothetical protein
MGMLPFRTLLLYGHAALSNPAFFERLIGINISKPKIQSSKKLD